MTNEMFNHVANVFLDYLKTNLVKKGKEYSPTGNRFHNFELAATEYANQGVRTEDNILLAMQGMRYKHDISVDDIRRAVLHDSVFHGDGKRPEFDAAYLIEKYGDQISYLIIEFEYILSEYGKNLGPEWDVTSQTNGDQI